MTRLIDYSVLFDWDGSGNFSFNEKNYVELVSGDESISPPGESSFSGSGFITQLTIDLINTDSRFSTTNASSPIYSYISNGGFLQKKVIVTLKIDGIGFTIFTGYIKSMNEVFRNGKTIGKVKVVCRSQDDIIKNMQISTLASISRLAITSQFDEGEIIKRTLEAAGLVDNVNFRSQTYSNPTIDRGLFTIPYFWLEKESPVEDAWLLSAACAGRFYFNSEDGLFYYKNAFAYGKGKSASSQETLNESNCESIEYKSADNELIESVSVTARTRYITESKEIWGSEKPIKVAPNSTQEIECEISQPVIEASSTNFTTTSASGMLINSGISVSISSVYSKKVVLSVTNTTNRLVYLRNLVLIGKLLEPLDNIDYSSNSSLEFWSSRIGSEKKVSSNPYVQTYAQAKAIGDITLDRQANFSTEVSIRKFKGTKILYVGDLVTVFVSGKLNGQFIITKSKINLSTSGFYQDFDLISASGIYGLSIGDYFIIGTHSQNSAKKLFY